MSTETQVKPAGVAEIAPGEEPVSHFKVGPEGVSSEAPVADANRTPDKEPTPVEQLDLAGIRAEVENAANNGDQKLQQ